MSHVAINILSFLKRNATKEGHTYWLFKRKNDPVVKLYDLTSLCEQQLSSGEEQPAEDFDEKNLNPDKPLTTKTPFQDAVSMLLYKLARNIIRTKRNGLNLPLKGKKYLFKYFYTFSQKGRRKLVHLKLFFTFTLYFSRLCC